MTAIKITIDDIAVTDALHGLINAGRDMSPAMRAIARLLRNTAEDAFGQQASPFGSPCNPPPWPAAGAVPWVPSSWRLNASGRPGRAA